MWARGPGWKTCASTIFGDKRPSATGFACTTMLLTSFPDRASGRTTLVTRGATSGEAAQATDTTVTKISLEQKRTIMFFPFRQEAGTNERARRKPNVIISVWHDRGTCW